MDSRKKFFTLLVALLALLLGCALPTAVAGADDFQSQVRAPLSPAQAAELRAATEAASFSAQASRGASLGISQAQAQPASSSASSSSSFRLNAGSTLQAQRPLQAQRLFAPASIPEAPGWMVFLVCIIIALFVARRAFGGTRS